MSEAVIQVKGLTFSYRNSVVLRDINLELFKKDFLGIIGPNGGGKTTLLKLMLGLLKPSSGEVLFKGKPLAGTMTKNMGYVPQVLSYQEDFPITVMEVVLAGRLGRKGLFAGYSPEDIKVAEAVLAKVELSGIRDRHLSELSGGQRQRVMIARALVSEPAVLLLDEPTSNIDTAVEGVFYDLLTELNATIPIVLVSHDIGVVASRVNKIACLNGNLYYHDSNELTQDMLEQIYHCPIDLVAHGVAHRVFAKHENKKG